MVTLRFELAKSTPGRLKKMAQERGIPLPDLILSAIHEAGSVNAAAKTLGLSSAWPLQRWLSANNYMVTRCQTTVVQKRDA